MANVDTTARAEHYRVVAENHAREVPCGVQRAMRFPGEIRMKLIHKDGRDLYEVDGYATVFSRGYEMWDMFGKYTEMVDIGALDKSLAANPDVAFLVNHRGVTMARTTNQSLDLTKDSTGLAVHAFLNAERQDVRDLASAIKDRLIDEMSFAFMLDDGRWNDEYTQFTITEANIDRGDVSAVNYGANPYTSIEARSADWLRDIERMPRLVVQDAVKRIQTRLAAVSPADLAGIEDWEVVDDTEERTAESADDPAMLMSALDGMLDKACDLMSTMDMSACPPEAADAMDMMMSADAIADQLMIAMGLNDPVDPADPAMKSAPAKNGRPGKADAPEETRGRSVFAVKMRLAG